MTRSDWGGDGHPGSSRARGRKSRAEDWAREETGAELGEDAGLTCSILAKKVGLKP